MSRSVLIQTIVTLLAILVVGGFGVYALFMSNQVRTSQIVINVIDQNVRVELTGEADWVEDGAEDKTFTTQTTQNGFVDKVWNMRDLALTMENTENPANLHFKIINLNQNEVYDLKIVVEGVAYDQAERFSSFVKCFCLDEESQSLVEVANQRINQETPKFEVIVSGTTQEIDLTFSYLLLQFNSSFNINQAINITIATEVKTS